MKLGDITKVEEGSYLVLIEVDGRTLDWDFITHNDSIETIAVWLGRVDIEDDLDLGLIRDVEALIWSKLND